MNPENSSSRISLPTILLGILIIAIFVMGYLLWSRHHAETKPATPAPVQSVMPAAPMPAPVAAAPITGQIESGEFDDGLRNPASVTTHDLGNADEGITRTEVYYIESNGDGARMRITKSTFDNGTAHGYFQYKIELNLNGGPAPRSPEGPIAEATQAMGAQGEGGFIDITPADFRTVEGADCALQKIRFVFKPIFQVVKISRPWADTWVTPTMASKTVYVIDENQMKILSTRPIGEICDVSELF